MNTQNAVRYAILSLATLLISETPAVYGQTPGPAASYFNAVGIYKENDLADYPALFLSPIPYDPMNANPKGMTLYTHGYDSTEGSEVHAVFNLNATWGTYYWSLGPGNPTMEFTPEGLFINGAPVLTDASLLYPMHFAGISMGGGSTAGANAFAAGTNASASGLNSAAFGLGTNASGNNQFVLGQYNAPATDSLFVIGNGDSAVAPSNAFVVKRNGDTEIRGKLIAGNGASAAGSGAFAIGENANATGDLSIALGNSANAEIQGIAIGFQASAQMESVALGPESNASVGAAAFGRMSNAAGGGSVAVGNVASAGGLYSISIGEESSAGGPFSIAIGAFAYAQGENSVVLGWSNSATGIASVAMGNTTQSSGFASMAIGRSTTAQGLNQFVIGSYNVASGSPHSDWFEHNAGFPTWNANDEIFIVGNGVSDANRSNALTVKKNAATGIGTGIVTTTASQTVVGKYNDTSVGGLFVVGMGSGGGGSGCNS
jgi:YadA head domain repeat (2 copies)